MAKAKTNKKQLPQGNKALPWILLTIPFLLYIRTTGFGFSYHDDDVIILEGAKVLQQFNLKDIFFTDAWLLPGTIELYRPFQSLSFAVDYMMAEQNAGFYHFHNVVLFVSCVLLLFYFLKEIKVTEQHAFAIAGLYSVHYLFSQAVSWLPARGDLYLTVFSLGALWSTARFINTGKPVYALAILPLYFLAMLSKESGIVLPALLVLLYLLYVPDAYKKPQTYLYPAALIPVMLLYLWMQRQSVFPGTKFLSVGAMVYNLPVIPEEVFKFFVPLYYSVMPAFNPIATGAGMVLIVAILVGGYYFRNRLNKPLFIAGWVFFLLPLAPSLFYKPVFTGFAYDYLDHRMLFPYVGLFMVCYSLSNVYLPYFKHKYWLPGVMVFSAVLALYYSGNYQNRLAYYENATRTTPRSGLAILNYARVLVMEKKYDESLVQFNKLVEMFPDSMNFRLRRAALFIETKQYSRMLNECQSIIAKDPKYADAYFYMGGYYNDIGKRDSSYQIILRAIQADSTNAMYYFNLGTLYRQDNNRGNALRNFSKALTLNPKLTNAYAERGNLYGEMGLFRESADDYEMYVKLNPADPNGYFYRGQAYCLSGNAEKGCPDLRKADSLGLTIARDKLGAFCK